MEAGERPDWMRAFAIALGVIAIIIGILALAFPEQFGFPLLIILFSIGLLIVGLFGIVAGFRTDLPGWSRALSLVIGVLVIILVIVFLIADLILFVQVVILGIGLLLLGIRVIVFEGTDKSLPAWARGLAIALGVLAIIIAGIMIGVRDVGETFLLIYFAIGLFATGVGAIVAGVSA